MIKLQSQECLLVQKINGIVEKYFANAIYARRTVSLCIMMVIVVPYLTPSIDSYNNSNDSLQDLMNIYETLINFIAS